MRNPVKRYMHKSVQASVVPQKQRKLKSEATLRDVDELLSEGDLDSETMCFDEDLQGCLDCVGCSNIEIDCEED